MALADRLESTRSSRYERGDRITVAAHAEVDGQRTVEQGIVGRLGAEWAVALVIAAVKELAATKRMRPVALNLTLGPVTLSRRSKFAMALVPPIKLTTALPLRSTVLGPTLGMPALVVMFFATDDQGRVVKCQRAAIHGQITAAIDAD